MSDGDDEAGPEDSETDPADEPSEAEATAADEGGEELTVERLEERTAAAEEDLEGAETEADLDAVEATLDDIESDVKAADLPEPEDEDEEDPREELESRLSDLRESLEGQRGPYAEDVVEGVEAAKTDISETRWTERGKGEVVDAVESFADRASGILDGDFAPAVSGDGADAYPEDALRSTLDDVAAAVESADLDPDEDDETIADLLEAAEELQSDLEDAEEWGDLEVREQLEAEGFYEVLGHYKDFPPEWSALKEHEKRGNVEMVLLALEKFGSDFMEEHCLHAIIRMNDDRAFDAMHQRAQKRDKPSIRALGTMGGTDAVETLLEYVDTDKNPTLQKVTFKALGQMGSEEATQPLADKLVMENDNVRTYAARALGLLGDTRAIDPLTDTLADDDSETVRASAAWALRQIGTERALEAAADYADDRSYLVQNEAEGAAEGLEAADDEAAAAAR